MIQCPSSHLTPRWTAFFVLIPSVVKLIFDVMCAVVVYIQNQFSVTSFQDTFFTSYATTPTLSRSLSPVISALPRPNPNSHITLLHDMWTDTIEIHLRMLTTLNFLTVARVPCIPIVPSCFNYCFRHFLRPFRSAYFAGLIRKYNRTF